MSEGKNIPTCGSSGCFCPKASWMAWRNGQLCPSQPVKARSTTARKPLTGQPLTIWELNMYCTIKITKIRSHINAIASETKATLLPNFQTHSQRAIRPNHPHLSQLLTFHKLKPGMRPHGKDKEDLQEKWGKTSGNPSGWCPNDEVQKLNRWS